ncbi:unnamed protein product [Lota lota]
MEQEEEGDLNKMEIQLGRDDDQVWAEDMAEQRREADAVKGLRTWAIGFGETGSHSPGTITHSRSFFREPKPNDPRGPGYRLGTMDPVLVLWAPSSVRPLFEILLVSGA